MNWLKIAVLTIDNREHCKNYAPLRPDFGAGSEALLEGFAVAVHKSDFDK
ncbi:MAG TPA: hypothetical protein VE344_11390 [Methylomirabilota bacterium]|nr:hypothetical protein [Methylomirabilota bacterium]